jgi:hypothetical protein
MSKSITLCNVIILNCWLSYFDALPDLCEIFLHPLRISRVKSKLNFYYSRAHYY